MLTVSTSACGAEGLGSNPSCGDQIKNVWTSSEEVITLPCHGRDRGFKSLLVRHIFLSSSAVERPTVNRNVAGSNPAWGANYFEFVVSAYHIGRSANGRPPDSDSGNLGSNPSHPAKLGSVPERLKGPHC